MWWWLPACAVKVRRREGPENGGNVTCRVDGCRSLASMLFWSPANVVRTILKHTAQSSDSLQGMVLERRHDAITSLVRNNTTDIDRPYACPHLSFVLSTSNALNHVLYGPGQFDNKLRARSTVRQRRGTLNRPTNLGANRLVICHGKRTCSSYQQLALERTVPSKRGCSGRSGQESRREVGRWVRKESWGPKPVPGCQL